MRFLTLVNLLHHLNMYIFAYLDEKRLSGVVFASIDLIDRFAPNFIEFVITSSDYAIFCI